MIDAYKLKDGDVLFYIIGTDAYSGYVRIIDDKSFNFHDFTNGFKILFHTELVSTLPNSKLVYGSIENFNALKTLYPECDIKYELIGSSLAKYMFESEDKNNGFLCKCSNVSDADAVENGELTLLINMSLGKFFTVINGYRNVYDYAVPVDHFTNAIKMDLK